MRLLYGLSLCLCLVGCFSSRRSLERNFDNVLLDNYRLLVADTTFLLFNPAPLQSPCVLGDACGVNSTCSVPARTAAVVRHVNVTAQRDTKCAGKTQETVSNDKEVSIFPRLHNSFQVGFSVVVCLCAVLLLALVLRFLRF